MWDPRCIPWMLPTLPTIVIRAMSEIRWSHRDCPPANRADSANQTPGSRSRQGRGQGRVDVSKELDIFLVLPGQPFRQFNLRMPSILVDGLDQPVPGRTQLSGQAFLERPQRPDRPPCLRSG
jgi:hypothetical protein